MLSSDERGNSVRMSSAARPSASQPNTSATLVRVPENRRFADARFGVDRDVQPPVDGTHQPIVVTRVGSRPSESGFSSATRLASSTLHQSSTARTIERYA